MNFILTSLLSLVLVVCTCLNANADLVFSDRIAFEAAIGAPIVEEGFETYAIDLQDGPRTVSLGLFNVSYNGSERFGVWDGERVGNVGPTEGDQFLMTDFGNATTVVFDLHMPTTALGLDLRDTDNGFNITYQTSTGSSGTASFDGADGNIQFFGIAATSPFDSITFQASPQIPGPEGIAFDRMVVAVPEPSSFAAMFAIAYVMTVGRRRRKLTLHNQ